MNVLIMGAGGREYSIGLALSKDESIEKIYFAPGNGATDELGENLSISDFSLLADFVERNDIDLTIVGPEGPLVDGVVDVFEARGLKIFGPTAKAAQLEGSKIFMKNFLARHNIPTAKYIQTDSLQDAYAFIMTLEVPIVVKADGLCGGKGVIIAQSRSMTIYTTLHCLLSCLTVKISIFIRNTRARGSSNITPAPSRNHPIKVTYFVTLRVCVSSAPCDMSQFTAIGIIKK